MENSFIAIDSDGTPYTIFIIQETLSQTTAAGTRTSKGARNLLLESGEVVNRIAKGKYQAFVGFDTITLTSDDPDAP